MTQWFDLPSGTLLPFLTHLEIMDLSWNDLLGGSLKALSVHMQHLGKLKVLKLSGCRLTAEDLGALGERKSWTLLLLEFRETQSLHRKENDSKTNP